MGGSSLSATVADFDRDGALDLLTTSSASTFAGNVALNTGPGGNLSVSSHPAAGNPTTSVVGDFNRNRLPDFAVVNQPTNTVTVYLNQCPPTGSDDVFADGFE